MPLLMGIDLGTQGAKGLLVREDGHLTASAYREYTPLATHPGWAEQDAQAVWWTVFVQLVGELMEQAGVRGPDIAAVGISACVPALLLLDSQDRPLRPAMLYTDRRAQSQVDWLTNRLSAAGLTTEQTGELSAASPVAQLLWVRENEPDVFSRAARMLQCHTYLVYRLTGQSVIDHAMKRSYAPLYDPMADRWSGERARLIDLDPSILPDRIAGAQELAGQITAAAARECKLLPGTAVAVGTADAFAEMIGAGVVQAGSAALLYGSFTALLVGEDQPVADWHGFHCLPNLYFSGAAVPTGALLTRWFRDELGEPERVEAARTGANPYALLDQLAQRAPPGSAGLIALPDFSGGTGVLHPSLSPGALVGLTLEHHRAHLYRALLEGVAYELRFQLEGAAALPDPIAAAGGGAASAAWTQIASDILGVSQQVLETPFTAPLGSAYLAGLAAGLFKDTRPLLDRWIRVKQVVEPHPAHRDLYASGFESYQAVRRALGPAVPSRA